jgi:hypothetical protein
VALRNRTPISTAPGGPYADKGKPTVYQPSRGGHFPEDKPTAGSDATTDGRNSGLSGGQSS